MKDERRVTVLAKEDVLKRDFFQWVNVRFQFRRFDETLSETVERIVFERGDSVGMLMHDVRRDEVILVEQLRIATLGNGTGWLLEIPAGMIDGADSPEATALREIREETGGPPAALELISTFYMSPGACSERIHLFYAPYPEGLEIQERAGLASENEDIRVCRVPFADALEMIKDGRIADAKTIVGLLWLQTRAR
jgi:ADP-ribose pyrophosphatase